jgi:hypothetical protein
VSGRLWILRGFAGGSRDHRMSESNE